MLCLALPAYADDTARWGASPNLADNSSVTLTLTSDGPHVASVRAVNRLTGDTTPDSFTVTLQAGALVVRVYVEQGPGRVPDVYTVTPPAGYVAVPSSVSVAEGDEAVIEIVEAGSLPMG